MLQCRPPGVQTQPGAQAPRRWASVWWSTATRSVSARDALLCTGCRAAQRRGGIECAQQSRRQCDDANASRHTGTDVHRIGERLSRRSASTVRRQRCHRHLQARTHRLVTVGCTRRRSAGDSAFVCCRAAVLGLGLRPSPGTLLKIPQYPTLPRRQSFSDTAPGHKTTTAA